MYTKISKAAVAFTAVFLAFIFVFGGWVLLKSPDTLSKSERRQLAARPKITASSVWDGSYFTSAEKYLLDQFPLRESFRTVKALNRFYVFRQKDNHGIFIKNGFAVSNSYPLSDKSVEVYLKRVNAISEVCSKKADVNIFNTVIPDKAYFLASEVGCPSIDYDALRVTIKNGAPGKYVEIFDTFSYGCYYKTDSHWSQDKIVPTADRLLEAMGAGKNSGTYVKDSLSPFYGVYYGESALPLAPDTIRTVGSPVIDSVVFTRANKKTGELEASEIYKTENITADDAYDVFLEGASTVAVLNNTVNPDGKTLYLFSDSFGRSLAPLLLAGYGKVVVFDIRYIKLSSALEIIPLESGSDVLIAYSISAIDVSSNLQVG